MEKKGQFYLVTIIIIISIFMGFITIVNSGKRVQTFDLKYLSDELNIEKRYILDYVSYNSLSDIETGDIFLNFSKNYINKIGVEKDSLFIFGKQGSIKLFGNKIEETLISVYNGTEYLEITESGIIEKDYTFIDEFKIKIEENEYIFKLEKGQNFYYLVHHIINSERYIIYG